MAGNVNKPGRSGVRSPITCSTEGDSSTTIGGPEQPLTHNNKNLATQSIDEPDGAETAVEVKKNFENIQILQDNAIKATTQINDLTKQLHEALARIEQLNSLPNRTQSGGSSTITHELEDAFTNPNSKENPQDTLLKKFKAVDSELADLRKNAAKHSSSSPGKEKVLASNIKSMLCGVGVLTGALLTIGGGLSLMALSMGLTVVCPPAGIALAFASTYVIGGIAMGIGYLATKYMAAAAKDQAKPKHIPLDSKALT